MKFRILVPGLLLLVVLVAACSPAPNLRNPKFLKDSSVITKDEKCDAPCWRGIIPGETKWSDALIILQDQTDIDDPQVQAIPDAGDAVGASWQPTGGESCCQIISEDGKTVSSIFLQIAPDLTVKQLIDARGEPDYVLGTPGTDDQAILNLFYPKQNMIVFAFVAGAANGKLSETSEIIGVYYTTPDRMDLGVKLSSLYGWKGYEAFTAYAPDNPSPDYKITQSITLTPTGQAAAPATDATATPEGTSDATAESIVEAAITSEATVAPTVAVETTSEPTAEVTP